MNPQELVPFVRDRSRWGSALALFPGLAFALMLLVDPVAGQTGRVTGMVTDRTSGAPLGEVQLFLPGASLGALSRSNGRYLILNVPTGTHEVSAQRVGLGLVTQTVGIGDPNALRDRRAR
jgi:hypothetical protein